jgi:hypothetical protein
VSPWSIDRAPRAAFEGDPRTAKRDGPAPEAVLEEPVKFTAEGLMAVLGFVVSRGMPAKPAGEENPKPPLQVRTACRLIAL